MECIYRKLNDIETSIRKKCIVIIIKNNPNNFSPQDLNLHLWSAEQFLLNPIPVFPNPLRIPHLFSTRQKESTTDTIHESKNPASCTSQGR